MDLLINAADFYNEFMKYKFTLIFGDKKRKQYIITIAAKSEHFSHLVGLDKLKDINSSIYKKHNKSQIIDGIQNGDITTQQIEKSSHYTHERFEQSIKNRLEFFPLLQPIFENGWNKEEVTFIFIKKKAYSKIDADYLIRFKMSRDSKDYYLNLFLKKDNFSAEFIPISFFPRLNNDYEENQPRLTLLYKARITEDRTDVLYIHKGFNPPC